MKKLNFIILTIILSIKSYSQECMDSRAINFMDTIYDCILPLDFGTLSCGSNIDSAIVNWEMYPDSIPSTSVLHKSIFYRFNIDDYRQIRLSNDFNNGYVFIFNEYGNLVESFNRGNSSYSSSAGQDNLENLILNLNPGLYTVCLIENAPSITIPETLSEYYNYAINQDVYNNYNFWRTIEIFNTDGNCSQEYGCNDSQAINFNSLAIENDGSCIIPNDLGVLDCGMPSYLVGTSLDEYQDTNNSFIYEFELEEYSNIILDLTSNSNLRLYLFNEDGEFEKEVTDKSSFFLSPGKYFSIVSEPSDISNYDFNDLHDWMNQMSYQNLDEDNFNLQILAFNDECEIYGCTESSAFNFNSLATINDSSCHNAIELGPIQCGVMLEHNSENNSGIGFENSSYLRFELENSADVSFNLKTGNINDLGFLVFDGQEKKFERYLGNNSNYYSDSIQVNLSLEEGIYDIVLLRGSYYSPKTSLNSTYVHNITNVYSGMSFNLDIFYEDEACETSYLPGCTDTIALNFNPQATEDNNSCDTIPLIDPMSCYYSEYSSYDDDEFGDKYFIRSLELLDSSRVIISSNYSHTILVFNHEGNMITWGTNNVSFFDLLPGEYTIAVLKESYNSYYNDFISQPLYSITSIYELYDLLAYPSYVSSSNITLYISNTNCGPISIIDNFNSYICHDTLAFNYLLPSENVPSSYYDDYCVYEQNLGNIECGLNQDTLENSVFTFDISDYSEVYIADNSNDLVYLFDENGFFIESEIIINNEKKKFVYYLDNGSYYGFSSSTAINNFSDMTDFSQKINLDRAAGEINIQLFEESCEIEDWAGCTDSSAFNYDRFATEDNGSCHLPHNLGLLPCGTFIDTLISGTGISGNNLGGLFEELNPSIVLEFSIQDTIEIELSLKDNSWWSNSSPNVSLYDIDGEYMTSIDIEQNSNISIELLPGKYYLLASNPYDGYDEFENINLYDVYFESFHNYQSFNSYYEAVLEISIWDNQCEIIEKGGCTDPQGLNFDSLATQNDESCIYLYDFGSLACDSSYQGYLSNSIFKFSVEQDSTYLDFNVSDYFQIFDENGANIMSFYSAEPIMLDQGEYFGYYYNYEPSLYFNQIDLENTYTYNNNLVITPFNLNCSSLYFGCSDSLAINYNPLSTNENAGCQFPQEIGLLECGREIEFDIPYYSYEAFYEFSIEDSSDISFNFETNLGDIHIYIFDQNNDLHTLLSPSDSGYQCVLPEGNFKIVSLNFLANSTTVFDLFNEKENSVNTNLYYNSSFNWSITNYNGECNYYGCTDTDAYNYSPIATEDDNSCDLPIELGNLNCGTYVDTSIYIGNTQQTRATFFEFSLLDYSELYINLSESSSSRNISVHIFKDDSLIYDEDQHVSSDYSPNAEINISPLLLSSGNYKLSVSKSSFSSGIDNFNDYYQDHQYHQQQQQSYYNYLNFSLDLFVHEDACENYTLEGCIDSTAMNFNPLATLDDESCELPVNLGNITCGTYIDTTNSTWSEYGFGNSIYHTLNLLEPSEIFIELQGSYSSNQLYIFGPDNNLIETFNFANNDENEIKTINLFDGNYTICTEIADGTYTNLLGFTTLSEYYQKMKEDSEKLSWDYTHQFNLKLSANNQTCDYKLGCTDLNAINYDSLATIYDRSCLYLGCTDISADNYNANANVIGYCEYPGCTDEIAINFMPTANLDNQTCEYSTVGCMNTTAQNYDSLAQTDDGSCEIIGCTIDMFPNYNPIANIDNGLCDFASGDIFECTDSLYIEFDTNANTDNGTCSVLISFGCTDTSAFNYNPNANIENDSCEEIIPGCTNSEYLQFNIDANLDNETCENIISYGCSDQSAFNYNINANIDDYSCIPIIYGCMLSEYMEYNPQANIENESCDEIAYYGCTDSLYLEAWNLSIQSEFPDTIYIKDNLIYSNVDDGSCTTPIVEGCYIPYFSEYQEGVNVYDASCVIPAVYGCTDSSYLEYWSHTILPNGLYSIGNPTNVYVNTDDGSCLTPIIIGCTYDIFLEYNSTVNTLNVDSCITLVVNGCTDTLATNYNSEANYHDESCNYNIDGCTDQTAFNFNPIASTDDGSCIETINGCTNINSINYNENANTDNGSCISIIEGCMDEEALNYDQNANTENNSCITIIIGCMDINYSNYDPNANSAGDCYFYDDMIDSLVNLINIVVEQNEICQNNLTSIEIDLNSGWNMIGYWCSEPVDVIQLTLDIVDYIIVLKNNNGDVYFPEFNFNGIGNLTPGHGYQLKITNSISGYDICDY